jgi:hypothetical protein
MPPDVAAVGIQRGWAQQCTRTFDPCGQVLTKSGPGRLDVVALIDLVDDFVEGGFSFSLGGVTSMALLFVRSVSLPMAGNHIPPSGDLGLLNNAAFHACLTSRGFWLLPPDDLEIISILHQD